MTTAAYDAQAAAFAKRPQWLVEIDLDRCQHDYTSAPCTASDAGDGSRCHYTFGTCQDPANYTKETRTLRFCLRNVPWPDTDYPVFPYLLDVISVPQKIDAGKLLVYPEKIKLRMALDHNPVLLDSGKTLFNTSTAGEFWRNLFARNRNYVNRPVRIKRGFYADGFALSDFAQVGPTYELSGYRFSQSGGDDTIEEYVEITAESPLRTLNKKKVPVSASEDNVLTSAVNDSATTLSVYRGEEYYDPTEFTRNTIYVRIDSEIISYTGISGDSLTGCTRGAFGTTAASHAKGAKVEQVACFGATDGTARNVIDVIRDLMEYAGIASGDIDTTSFDQVKEQFWPGKDTNRIVTRPRTVAKLIQELRELRGIIIFIDSAGEWSCTTIAPRTATLTLTDDDLVAGTVSVKENEDRRITRVSIWYSPTEEDADDQRNFSKSAIVVGIDLENANAFGDEVEETVLDNWVDETSVATAEVANIGRRVLARRAYGERMISATLELGNGTLNVGDFVDLTTRHLTGTLGEQLTRSYLVVGRREVGASQIAVDLIDANFNGRYLRIGENTQTDDYDSATDAEKLIGYWGDETYNRVGTKNEEGYTFA